MNGFIDITDFSTEELFELIDTATDIAKHPKKYAKCCEGKKLATLFFEPSTRTRLSFEAAMYELGGHVISTPGSSVSSASKGESMADTAKVLSCYADIIAMRHNLEGAAFVADDNASVPVINAGDGGHCHPTQTLADLLTIYREKGRIYDLTIGLCGDLKYGRTVHSLISLFIRYPAIRFVLISPDALKIPAYIREDVLEKNNIPFVETASLEEVLPTLDVLYMTRIQGERFEDKDEYERLKDSYVLTEEKMETAKPNCIVMHPLPRVNEISVQVDKDPRAAYFRQVMNGKLMRMALILKLLGLTDRFKAKEHDARPVKLKAPSNHVCVNPKCISQKEQELEPRFYFGDETKKEVRCFYCDMTAKAAKKRK